MSTVPRGTNNSAGNRGGRNNNNNNATGTTIDLAALIQAIQNAGVGNPPANPYSTVTDAYDHTNWARLGDPRVMASYISASEPASDFTRLDIGVPTALKLMELLKDKEQTYGWGPLTNVPLEGTGAIAAAAKRIPGGGVTFNVDLRKTSNLFTNYNLVTKSDCQNFVGWINGGINARLPTAWEPDPTKRFIEYVDPDHATENIRLVNRERLKLRAIDNLSFRTIHNHTSMKSWNALMVYQDQFSFIDRQTNEVKYSGLLLARFAISLSKPDLVIDTRQLENKLETMKITDFNNDVNDCLTEMISIKQEIHANSGKQALPTQRYLTQIFRALSHVPIDKYQLFLDRVKEQWITGELTDEAAILRKLLIVWKNMVGDGEWKIDTTKHEKIVALTTDLATQKNDVEDLRRRLRDAEARLATRSGRGGTTLSRIPSGDQWRVTYNGDTLVRGEVTYDWCAEHKSKDGSVPGSYMKAPHDHSQWLASRIAKQDSRNKHSRTETPSTSAGAGTCQKAPPAKKLKLALNATLANKLICDHGMSKEAADALFNQTYMEAEGSLK